MLERLQSALKAVKDTRPPSMMSHRFVTVRRGSPAARSGQVQPGDQLEAVEGRPVASLQHRDLAQILRRAGNTLRLSITPRHQSSEGADLDTEGHVIKGPRGSKDESRFYSVDLERGPTGFGFSLRGGSEYNMGLYVLGLMEGGPAQRSNKIQVSDQLVEINGDSTVGMTHSQAVEQIRRGGTRIHLILKKGNGYVPDYGPEEGAPSHFSSPAEEQHSVAMTTSSLSQHWRGGGATGGGGGERRRRKTEKEAGARQRSGSRGGGGLGPPDLDLDVVEEEARDEEARRRKEEEEERWRRMKEEEEKMERRSQTLRQKKREQQREQGRRSRSLPRQEASSWASPPPPGEESGRRRSQTMRDDNTSRNTKHPGSSAQRAAFSFLMPMDDDECLSNSESGAGFSEVSQSATSMASARRRDSDWRRAGSPQQQGKAPGPWLKPSPQRLTQVLSGSRPGGRELRGGLSL